MDKQKRLGRGFASLISDDGTEDPSLFENRIEVDIQNVYANPDQPRKTFHQGDLEELSQSIQKFGVLQPILVQKSVLGYQIIAGERRWRASKIAGLNRIPIVIHAAQSSSEVVEMALIENIQREDLNCIEEAQAFQSLIDSHGYTQAMVASRVGKDRSHIANTLRLLNL
ncbi:MAG: ParB/RepB/Spo0J family partition protein, partial [Deltaproteobacteria bacterium]|nr:ParB/RepB/Spo0J family partition protein [Deltaproteobacteria bacterium]